MQVCRGGEEISFTNMGLVAEMVLAQVCVCLVSSFIDRLYNVMSSGVVDTNKYGVKFHRTLN